MTLPQPLSHSTLQCPNQNANDDAQDQDIDYDQGQNIGRFPSFAHLHRPQDFNKCPGHEASGNTKDNAQYEQANYYKDGFFFRFHDPTQLNRQGPDVGSQYRSAIFYHSDEQKKDAENLIQQLGNSGRFQSPIVTQVKPASEFYLAEEYHQKFYEKLSKRKR